MVLSANEDVLSRPACGTGPRLRLPLTRHLGLEGRLHGSCAHQAPSLPASPSCSENAPECCLTIARPALQHCPLCWGEHPPQGVHPPPGGARGLGWPDLGQVLGFSLLVLGEEP